jgi:hypothetical protein
VAEEVEGNLNHQELPQLIPAPLSHHPHLQEVVVEAVSLIQTAVVLVVVGTRTVVVLELLLIPAMGSGFHQIHATQLKDVRAVLNACKK